MKAQFYGEATFVSIIFVFGIIAGVYLNIILSQPPCTAYQAVDGKPVCIEYKTFNH